jgi:hypothetical protein
MAPVFLLSARLVVRIRDPLIIASSVGKTTTTEMIVAVPASQLQQPVKWVL